MAFRISGRHGWGGILTCSSIQTVSLYQHPVTSLGFPHPTSLLPRAAPANIMVSLPLQLMKAKVLAESSSFHLYLSKDIYRHDSGRCHTLLPFVTHFLSTSNITVSQYRSRGKESTEVQITQNKGKKGKTLTKNGRDHQKKGTRKLN